MRRILDVLFQSPESNPLMSAKGSRKVLSPVLLQVRGSKIQPLLLAQS